MVYKYTILLFVLLSVFLEARDTFFVPARSDDADQKLQKAMLLAKNKRWEDAAAAYQNILEKYGHFVTKVSSKLYKSVREVVLERLRNFPPQILKSYQKLFDKKAQRLIAGREHEHKVLIQLFQNFLYTKTGVDAFICLIDDYISSEEYEKAVSHTCFFLKKNRASKKHRQAVMARLAFCYFAMGKAKELRKLLQLAQQMRSKQKIKIGGKNILLTKYIKQMFAKVQKRFISSNFDSQWPMLGKTTSHGFHSKKTLPFFQRSRSTQIPKPDRKKTKKYYYNEQPRMHHDVTPYYPIIGENTIFINNGKDIFAYSLLSHDLKWHFKGLIAQLESDYNEHVIHSCTYHKGAIYANLEDHAPTQSNENWSIYQIRKILAERRLVKIDANTGRILWKLNKPNGGEDAFENKASFMSPPVPWAGYLYAGATELTGLFNSYVTAIHPKTGKVIWKTLVGSAQQEQNLFGRPVRESVSTMVAAGNGRVYYLTNLGAVASLDPLTGNISWMHLYDRIALSRPRRALFTTRYRKTGWYNSPIILSNDSIFIAPLDSNRLYCLDAWSGVKKWSRYRGPSRYLLAVVDGKVIIGGDKLEVLDARNGGLLTSFKMNGQKVIGMGSVSGNLFYFPGEFDLYCLDLKTLKLKSKTPWKNSSQQAGHIVMADSVWVTASKNSFTTFYDFRTLEKSLKTQIANKTKNPFPYLQLANLYSQKYKKAQLEAVKLYKRGLELAKKNNSNNSQFYVSQAQKGLLHLYTKLAEVEEKHGKLKQVHKYYNKILNLSSDPKVVVPLLFKQYFYYKRNKMHNKVEANLIRLHNNYGKHTHYFPDTGTVIEVAFYAHILLAQHYKEVGNLDEAVKKYQELVVVYRNKIYEGFTGQLLGFINIQKIIEKHGRKHYSFYDKQAEVLYKNSKNSTTKLLRILQRYPNSQYVPNVSLQLAYLFIKRGNIHKTAEHLRQYIRKYPKANNIAQANYLLVQCYEKIQAFAASRSILEQMSKEFSKDKITTLNGKKMLVEAFVREKFKESRYRKILRRSVVRLELRDKDSKAKYHFEQPEKGEFLLRLLPVSGTADEKFSHLVFLNLSEKIFCRDGRTGKLLWQVSLGWITGIGFVGPRLMAWNSRNIFCLSPVNGKIKWQSQTKDRYVDVKFGVNAIAVANYEKSENLTTVIVLEPETGTKRWSQSFYSNQATNLRMGTDTLLAFNKPPVAPVIYLFSLNTGRLIHRFEEKALFRKNKYHYNPLMMGNFLCITQKNRWVECYQISNMKRIWRYDGEKIQQGSFIGNEQYICFTQKDDQLTVLDLPTGAIKWTWKIPSESRILKRTSDWDAIYFVESKNAGDEGMSVWALDIRDGSLKWTAPLTEQQFPGFVELQLTQDYVLGLSNIWINGWKSSLILFDKITGKRRNGILVKDGDRGKTPTEMGVVAKNLWLIKDNNAWVYGK